jgi:hypothetical protein
MGGSRFGRGTIFDGVRILPRMAFSEKKEKHHVHTMHGNSYLKGIVSRDWGGLLMGCMGR